jgi:hypothetical protein
MNQVYGISVYPDLQSEEEIADYITKASKYGFTRVFSSMWSVEGSRQEMLSYFQKLIQTAHACQMEVELDVNPDCLKKVQADYNDLRVFHEIGADILRMDISFGKEKDIVLVNNPYGIRIEFNASILPAERVTAMIQGGADQKQMLAGHNFYPQRYTGMKWQKFLRISKQLHEAGIPVSAFVSSHADHTIGVWGAVNGLPTVERMRTMPLDAQVRMLQACGYTDACIIGNACADETELKAMAECSREIKPDPKNPITGFMMHLGAKEENFYPQKKIRVIPDKNISDEESGILFGFFPHSDAGDSSEWIWRSRMPRFLKKKIEPRKWDGETFEPGSVVMVNDNYSHYAGELQIVRKPIVNDGTRNHIGMLSSDEMQILDLINDGDVVIFLKGGQHEIS